MLPDATMKNVQEWLFLETDPIAQEYINGLIKKLKEGDTGAEDELVDRFHEQIAFGTAGLRSEVGIGFSKMNTITVQLTTQVQCNSTFKSYILRVLLSTCATRLRRRAGRHQTYR